MATEPQRDDDWLEALAGRAPTGTDRDADLVRSALLPVVEPAPVRGWHEIEAAAAKPAAPEVSIIGRLDRGRIAANRPWARPLVGWAAGLMAVVTFGWLGWGGGETPVLRGGPSGTAQAQWLTADPAAHAKALAAELQSMGAQVRLEADGSAWVLRVEAPTPTRAAIDARLQELDTALDAGGRLDLSLRGN